MNKPKVLIFIDWFYPAFKAGGPIKSVFNLVENLRQEYEFTIITSAYDLDGPPLEVEQNQWIQKDYYRIIYLTKEQQKKKVYKKLVKEVNPDWVYYNSLFSVNFTLKPIIQFKGKQNFRQMIAPRGMLGKGALSIKPVKKSVFLKLAKAFLFKSSLFWHATSPEEFSEISNLIGHKGIIRIAANLASPLNEHSKQIAKKKGELSVFFLSRISPKKNLYFLLELLNDLKNLDQLRLYIYGPIEDQIYWLKCKPLIEADERIKYKGEIKPQNISEVMRRHHVFCLPTLNENYGHVIAEAFSNARPVIISDQTPWRQLKEKGIGEDLNLKDKNEWKNAIIEWVAMDQSEFDKYSENCFRFAQNNIVNSKLILDSKALFEEND